MPKSCGAVVFDPDATAGLRPSYFGPPEVGPVFVKNRYTDWPHLTLRNLWQLAGSVDPLRLRMEFLRQLDVITHHGNLHRRQAGRENKFREIDSTDFQRLATREIPLPAGGIARDFQPVIRHCGLTNGFLLNTA